MTGGQLDTGEHLGNLTKAHIKLLERCAGLEGALRVALEFYDAGMEWPEEHAEAARELVK